MFAVMASRLFRAGLCLMFAGALYAQPPRVGLVEYYGYQKLSPERISRMAGVAAGDPLPPAKADVVQQLERSPDVVQAHVEGYCCFGDQVVLYLGVLESGSRPFSLHSPPSEDLQLPLKLDLVYKRLLRSLEAAHGRGITGETLDRGYPLSEDAEARRAQETLALLVDPLVPDLGQIVRRAADDQVRAAAVYILAYTADRRAAESHLQYALRDFHPDVRQNALRTLDLVRRSLSEKPDGDFVVSSTWLIEMLSSVVWADRTEAAKVLADLTATRPESVLLTLEDRGLNSLAQMALWKTPEHAQAPYLLLGRIAGMSDDEILASFRSGNRELVLNAIRKRASDKRRFIFF